MRFCLARAQLLEQHNVTPIFVFDGGFLPIKGDKEEERKEKRESARQQGLVLHRCGNMSGAHQAFTKAVDVTPAMAFNLIRALKAKGIAYVVAPYEADAQLAYLCKHNMCDLVISEDSDCIPFGCSKVLFKLDAQGNGEFLDTSKLHRNKGIDLSKFTKDMLVDMCILAGCDYLPSVGGMGVKKAHSFVQQYKDTKKVLRCVRFSAAFDVPRDYEQRFFQAKMAFKHQRVFNSLATSAGPIQAVPLNPFSSDIDETTTDFLGPPLSDQLARGIASGELNPLTKQPIEPIPKKQNTKSTGQEGSQPAALSEQKMPESIASGKEKPLPSVRIRPQRPTKRVRQQNAIEAYMYKNSESAAAAFKQPRRTSATENSPNEGNFVPIGKKSKHFGGGNEFQHQPRIQQTGQPTVESKIGDLEDEELEGEIYHSDLVSPAFRPLPVVSRAKVASLRQALHACSDMEQGQPQPSQPKTSPKNPSTTQTNGFFQSYKFTAASGLNPATSAFYEAEDDDSS